MLDKYGNMDIFWIYMPISLFINLYPPIWLALDHTQVWNFVITRPKPAYGRQGLDWDRRARIQFGQVHFGAKRSSHKKGDPTDLLWCKNVTLPTGGPADLLWSKKRDVTNREIQLTSFDPKNMTLPTGRSSWPPLIQKRDVTNREIQLTTFDPKTWPLATGRSNWPFRCLNYFQNNSDS